MDTLKQLWKPGDEPRRGATAAEISTQRGTLQRAVDRLAAIKINCASCQQFEMGTCEKHGDVPLEFQKAEGECPDWSYDGVPF